MALVYHVVYYSYMWIEIRPSAPPLKQDVPTIFLIQLTKSFRSFNDMDYHLIRTFLALDPNFIDFHIDQEANEMVLTEAPIVRPIDGGEPIKTHYLSTTNWLVYEPHNKKIVTMSNIRFINDKNYGVASIKVPTARERI